MSSATFTHNPSLFSTGPYANAVVNVTRLASHKLTTDILLGLLTTAVGAKVGLAGAYGKGSLKLLVLATPAHALAIELPPKADKFTKLLGKTIADDATGFLGFDLHRLALALFGLGIRIKGLNAQSIATNEREPLAPVINALQKPGWGLQRDSVRKVFSNEKFQGSQIGPIVTRAWASAILAGNETFEVAMVSVPRTSTHGVPTVELEFLAKTLRDCDKLDQLKPQLVKNDVENGHSTKGGDLLLRSSRYKTRLRKTTQTIKVVTHSGQTVNAHARGVAGRQATLAPQKAIRGAIKSVVTIGPEPLTNAEIDRSCIILRALDAPETNRLILPNIPFIHALWFPDPIRIRPANTVPTPRISVTTPLNPSQGRALDTLLRNDQSPFAVVVQGPPGTGKTSVIAALVQCLQAAGSPVWLTAHSNVAVKNMAEKLAKEGFFDFRILVSKEFHFDWHEHLYTKIEANVIRSSSFPKEIDPVIQLLGDVKVVLCTISMFSHKRMGLFSQHIPLHTLIVDEASQIHVADYLPIFHTYRDTLRKIGFFGDDAQLAPYGQEDIPGLQSIFEIPHMRTGLQFLDTQYRMPSKLGGFLSRTVYDRKLKSVHANHEMTCCRLVDVGGSEVSSGHSWKVSYHLPRCFGSDLVRQNDREIQAVLHIARRLHNAGKEFRIITPYDAQRNAIELALKGAQGIPWEDRCFNVDSFQGNECDYIVLSVTRTSKPGFLTNKRRTNVMLSRCKQQMIICTNKSFVTGPAKSTLLGQLAKEWGKTAWISWQDVLNGRGF